MDNKQLAVLKKNTKTLIISDALDYPKNYSLDNALSAAWLVLQGTTNKNKRPVLLACSGVSIINAVRTMAVLGLTPTKKQCDFIAYGNNLTCQITYFGRMAVTLSMTDATDIFAEVIYKGDTFEYAVERGNKRLIEHVQKLENIHPGNIIAAYCTIQRKKHAPRMEVMTMDQIEAAWTMSKNNPSKADGPHQKFKDQMCKRTVINRACKYLINSSDDSGLRLQKYREAEDATEEIVFDEKVSEAANQGEIIDIQTSEPEWEGEPDENPPRDETPRLPEPELEPADNPPRDETPQPPEPEKDGPGF